VYARVSCDLCFFFQAEDGIRDFHVTGVQTCALPIYKCRQKQPAIDGESAHRSVPAWHTLRHQIFPRLIRPDAGRLADVAPDLIRSEELRVGKECRSRGAAEEERIRQERRGCGVRTRT